jgi:hypothetical protein
MIIMMETWIDKKRWKKLREKLPKDANSEKKQQKSKGM